MHQSKAEWQQADSAKGHHGKKYNANSHNVKRYNAKRTNAKALWRLAAYSVNNFSFKKKKRQSIVQGKGHIIAIEHFLSVYVMPICVMAVCVMAICVKCLSALCLFP